MAPLNVVLGHAVVGAWHVILELHQAGTWATATLGINKTSWPYFGVKLRKKLPIVTLR